MMKHRKIVEYDVVCSTDDFKFEESVNRLINRGFQPYGEMKTESGISSKNEFIVSHSQAMVKYED